MYECCSLTTVQHSTPYYPPSSSLSLRPWVSECGVVSGKQPLTQCQQNKTFHLLHGCPVDVDRGVLHLLFPEVQNHLLLSTYHRQTEMVHPHRQCGEEAATASLQPKEAEEIWLVTLNTHKLLQMHN